MSFGNVSDDLNDGFERWPDVRWMSPWFLYGNQFEYHSLYSLRSPCCGRYVGAAWIQIFYTSCLNQHTRRVQFRGRSFFINWRFPHWQVCEQFIFMVNSQTPTYCTFSKQVNYFVKKRVSFIAITSDNLKMNTYGGLIWNLFTYQSVFTQSGFTIMSAFSALDSDRNTTQIHSQSATRCWPFFLIQTLLYCECKSKRNIQSSNMNFIIPLQTNARHLKWSPLLRIYLN